MLCAPDAENEPATDRLLRDFFGMHRFEWPDDQSVEFHLGYGDMIRLLRRCGFEVEDLIEVRPREGRDDEPSLRAGGVGAPVAGGRDLESPEANAIAGRNRRTRN
jgi:hypothetical protein